MKRILPAALLFAATLAPSPADATSLYPMTTSELTWIADVIVEAEVVHAAAEWGPGEQLIRTVSTLRVVDTIKGDVRDGDELFVAQWGGRIGHATTTMPSSPAYIQGERVLVFLEWRSEEEGLYRTVGMIQGKFNLILEPDTGKDILIKLPGLSQDMESFDEALVRPPAVRKYCGDFVAGIRDEITLEFVPPYEPIPGVSQEKDAAYRAAAEAAGQTIDPVWDRFPRYNQPLIAEEGGR
jgi:hypothetical protein